MEKTAKSRNQRRTASRPAGGAASSGLEGEIRMLREALRREALDDLDQLTVGERMRVLDTVSKAASRLATLLKAERQLAVDQDMGATLRQALDDLLEELGPGV